MISINPAFIIFAFLALAIDCYPQSSLTGKVVGIIDGKTFVLETDNGSIIAAVQYIDVPEPEQPLSRIVREHLEKLVMGKTVMFSPNGFAPRAVLGRVLLNGNDLGQQLVRDGAAWQVPIERSGQNSYEAENYSGLEALARSERRGIWSIENLTPPWEFRAQKDRTFQEIGFLQPYKASSGEDTKNYRYAKADADMWVEVGGEVFAQKHRIGSMFWGYDSDKNIRNTSTVSVAQTLGNGEKRLEIEVRAIYFQGEIRPRTPNTAFVIGLLATSKNHHFTAESVLNFVADGTEINLGSGNRFWREDGSFVQEMLHYRIGRNDLHKLANAKKVTMQAGRYSGPVGGTLLTSLRELIETVK